MKVLVMHDSRYGNGRKVAEQIAGGLRESAMEVRVTSAKELKGLDLSGFGAFVLGTPIRIGSPTWRSGRAARRIGKSCAGARCVAFITQADPKLWGLPRWEARLAAAGLAMLMDGSGFHVIPPPAGAGGVSRISPYPIPPRAKALGVRAKFVKSPRGPLDDGELTRAREFGRIIGERLKPCPSTSARSGPPESGGPPTASAAADGPHR